MQQITGYHAHVYFDASTIDQARALCEQAAQLFPLKMGRVHERPVGPHPDWSCQLAFEPQVLAVDALIDGMQAANIARLFLVGDFDVLDDPETEDSLQRHAAEEIREALQSSPLKWTLVNEPRGVPGLTIEHFANIGGNLEPGLAEPLGRLARTAVGIADELHLNLHIGEHVNFIATDS